MTKASRRAALVVGAVLAVGAIGFGILSALTGLAAAAESGAGGAPGRRGWCRMPSAPPAHDPSREPLCSSRPNLPPATRARMSFWRCS